MEVKLSSYGPYNGNYGSHAMMLRLGKLTLWFSYETIVAFSDNGDRRVSENVWGSTTGKHLNDIDGGDKHGRLKREMFDQELLNVLHKYNLVVG